MNYVYAHKRADNDKIFYIGKGSGKRSEVGRRRNKHWNYIANKHGWYPEVLVDNLSEEEAYELETFMVEEIGLDNLTNVGIPNGEGAPKGTKPWNKGLTKKDAPQLSNSGAPKGIKNRLGTGNPFRQACLNAGIPMRTIDRWKIKGVPKITNRNKDNVKLYLSIKKSYE